MIRFTILCAVALVSAAKAGTAQDAQGTQHDHAQMNMSADWQFMQDGIVYSEFNHQPTSRGGDEFVVPNWWMGMAGRNTSHGRLTLASMLSLDPATVGKSGYRELFQTGEALDGKPLIDRQHPHDFFMQLAAEWRIPLTMTTGLTVVGAPVGEPALGPVAFMHRASAFDNPTAPLGHHTFDSTHISYGVVTASLDHGPWTVEGSVFNGREPDDGRWDFDFGALDSVSGRLWFRPDPRWELQVSTGHLRDPEQLHPGNLERTTTSLSWTHPSGANVDSVTVGYGRNDSDHAARTAVFAEAVRRLDANTAYLRFEAVQRESSTDRVFTLTLGGVRDVFNGGGVEGGFGADITVSRSPTPLRFEYGSHPASFHVFFRLRPTSARMWNMRMAQPMSF